MYGVAFILTMCLERFAAGGFLYVIWSLFQALGVATKKMLLCSAGACAVHVFHQNYTWSLGNINEIRRPIGNSEICRQKKINLFLLVISNDVFGVKPSTFAVIFIYSVPYHILVAAHQQDVIQVIIIGQP